MGFATNSRGFYKGDAAAVFKALDADRNGTITLQEFKDFNRKQPERNPLKDFLETRGMRLSSAPTGLFDSGQVSSHNPTSMFHGTFQDRQDFHCLRVSSGVARSSSAPSMSAWQSAPLGSIAAGGGIPPIQQKAIAPGGG